MAKNVSELLAVMLITAAPIVVFAQDMEQATEDALEKLDQRSVEVNSFVGEVRFNESDVKSLIDLWEDYSEFGEDEYEPEEDIDGTILNTGIRVATTGRPSFDRLRRARISERSQVKKCLRRSASRGG